MSPVQSPALPVLGRAKPGACKRYYGLTALRNDQPKRLGGERGGLMTVGACWLRQQAKQDLPVTGRGPTTGQPFQAGEETHTYSGVQQQGYHRREATVGEGATCETDAG